MAVLSASAMSVRQLRTASSSLAACGSSCNLVGPLRKTVLLLYCFWRNVCDRNSSGEFASLITRYRPPRPNNQKISERTTLMRMHVTMGK